MNKKEFVTFIIKQNLFVMKKTILLSFLFMTNEVHAKFVVRPNKIKLSPTNIHHILAHRGGSLTSPSISSQTNPTSKKHYQNRYPIYIKCMTIVSIWISTATIFYSKINHWPLPQSFFYAVDAGMSIGFCTDVKETTIQSRAFTIFHILLGASCVGGALALFVQDIMNDTVMDGGNFMQSSYYGEYKTLLEQDAFRRADKDKTGYLTYDQFRNLFDEWIMIHKKPTLQNKEELFQKLCKSLDPQNKGQIQFTEFMKIGYYGIIHYKDNNHLLHRHKITRFFLQCWDTLIHIFLGEHRIYLVFVLWIIMGISWGCHYQKWDVITSTHFAISALATGGLTAPPVNSDGILPTNPALFCGFYCLLGIPLFALTLGHYARILLSKHIQEANLLAIKKPLNYAEFELAAKSLCTTDNVIHISDFIVLQLLRQGKVNMDTIRLIQKQFHMLDTDHSGVLTVDQATQRL